jgi:radical SAM enzyme (TIGR01210 family)
VSAAATRRIRSLRRPKPHVDPWVAHGSLIEDERRPYGRIERALTVFLAGAECPYTCSFCDLWQFTIDGPTPTGALPRQLATVLQSVAGSPLDRVKLYNASNFFDRRAVPAADVPALAELARQFAGVTVESHASTVGEQTLDFARAIPGRLEVAMGLETIEPLAIEHLNKRLELSRFDRAADFLAAHDIDLRVFVLVGAPYVKAEESVEAAVRAAHYAARHGAAVVSLIPVRAGNGELERLRSQGHFTAPTLVQLERALDGCIGSAPAVFTADLWDVERMAGCDACKAARVARLRAINATGAAQPSVACDVCRQ